MRLIVFSVSSLKLALVSLNNFQFIFVKWKNSHLEAFKKKS